MLPRPSRATLARLNLVARRWRSGPGAERFHKARYALYQALREAGLGPGGLFFAPAYHCRSMVDPAKALGAEVVLYPVTADLGVDERFLHSELESKPTRVKVLLATHFFGWRQSFTNLRALCIRTGATLVEDCSHCLVGANGLPIRADSEGHVESPDAVDGDFVIASPYKFYPAPDGGTLWRRRNPAAMSPLSWPRTTANVRAWGAGIRDLLSTEKREPFTSGVTAPIDVRPCGAEMVMSDEGRPSDAFSGREIGKRSLAVSRWIVRHSSPAAIIVARRARFMQWARALDSCSGSVALHPSLEPEVVPYVFALNIAARPEAFFAIKRLGVPAGRWDDMLESDCRVASDYRQNLIHLPCHQELTDEQMHWMLSQVTRVLRD